MGTVRHSQQCVEVLFAEAWDNPPREWNEPAASPLTLSQAAVHSPARRYERFANGGLSSLAATIDTDDPELTVKSAVGFPTEGNFRITIDEEILLVTNVQGKTFVVERGQEGTSAAGHEADAAVFHVLTAGALAARDSDQFIAGTLANRDAAGQPSRLYFPNTGFACVDNGTAWDMLPYWQMTPPVIADFTWVNQGGATVTDRKGMMVLEPPTAASGDSLRLLVKTAPATPYKITLAMMSTDPEIISGTSGSQGICWRESGTGKIITFGLGRGTDTYSVYKWYHTQWTNPTTIAGGGQISARYVPLIWPYWVRFGDDGTNRTVEMSGDGITWQLYEAPESRSTFFTADQVGVYANQSLNTKTVKRVVSFLHWSESK
jgi:hypothetical protein